MIASRSGIPAELPVDWSVSTGGMPSEPRNPRLAHAFLRAGLIEAWGPQDPPGGVLRLRFPFSEDYLAADAAARRTAGSGYYPEDYPEKLPGLPRRLPRTRPGLPRRLPRKLPGIESRNCMRGEPELTCRELAELLGVTTSAHSSLERDRPTAHALRNPA